MMEDVAARRRGQEADSDADTDDLVLSGVEFIVSSDQFNRQQGYTKRYLRRLLFLLSNFSLWFQFEAEPVPY